MGRPLLILKKNCFKWLSYCPRTGINSLKLHNYVMKGEVL